VRIAVLWTGLSGYLNACLRTLAVQPGVTLFVSHMPVVSEAPFDESEFAWFPESFVWRSVADSPALQSRLEAFQPDLILVAGWHEPVYRPVLRRWRGRAFRLMAMDNAWRGSLKQWLGSLIAPWHVLPLADAAFVPGPRQHRFARHMGFGKIYEGSLSCDYEACRQVSLDRTALGQSLPQAFLYVGRLADYKGIGTMLAAYAIYRKQSAAEGQKAWPLIVSGAGPMASLFTERTGQPLPDGVDFRGFTLPRNLPALLKEAGCQIIPSHFEPWGLVAHEAAAAGIPILATTAVGASDLLLENGRNGYLLPPKDSAALASAMLRIAALPPEQIAEFSLHSTRLAAARTPLLWAGKLMELAEAWMTTGRS
jgi:glycosyltransferase involved in cell wall biosynthesis